MSMNPLLKLVFNIVGYAILFMSSASMLLISYLLVVHGKFVGVEYNLSISIIEFLLAIYGLVFYLFLAKKFVREQKHA